MHTETVLNKCKPSQAKGESQEEFVQFSRKMAACGLRVTLGTVFGSVTG